MISFSFPILWRKSGKQGHFVQIERQKANLFSLWKESCKPRGTPSRLCTQPLTASWRQRSAAALHTQLVGRGEGGLRAPSLQTLLSMELLPLPPGSNGSAALRWLSGCLPMQFSSIQSQRRAEEQGRGHHPDSRKTYSPG